MAKQLGLLQDIEQEIKEALPASEERKYLRLVGGKVIYISEEEAMEEEVLTAPNARLSEWDVLVAEYTQKAERLKERISVVHQMMRDDEQRPSQYQADYDMLWDEYRDVIECLRELDSETVDRFGDKVIARLRELEARINTVCDGWDPGGFDDFEQMLALYEKIHDQALALSKDGILK